MANREAFIVTLNCLMVHFFFALDLPTYILNNAYPVRTTTIGNVSIGVSLLLFPLFGLIADVYLTRYRTILVSLGSLVAFLIVTLVMLVLVNTIGFLIHHKHMDIDLIWSATLAGFFLVVVTSIGPFEANAIQFGMDQLLDASSSQLSAFIHWYFWSMHLGQEVVFGVALTFVFAIPEIHFLQLSNHEVRLTSLTTVCVSQVVWLSCILCSSFLLHNAKESMYVAKVGLNPFKKMWRVIVFAWKNKYPLNRSAFTYCEDNVPSRIDLGKCQYGGPFTVEEVEDVKTFFQLLILLVTLFGYHVAGDGFSVAQHLELYSCPSLTVWGLIVFNPSFVSSLVVLISIPLTQWLPWLHGLTPNMLKRIGIGMFVLLVQEGIHTYLMALPVVDKSLSWSEQGYGIIHPHRNNYLYCYYLRAQNSSGDIVNGTNSVDNTFLWLIGPQILNGFAQLLVHMTVLEFICAQAPRTTQGLLIGLWYATFSVRYLLMSTLDHVFTSSLGMLVYQAVRCGLVLVSLVFYFCASCAYQYRVRDWVVNVQWMVEDVIERRIQQEESYTRKEEVQRLTIYSNSSSDDDE